MASIAVCSSNRAPAAPPPGTNRFYRTTQPLRSAIGRIPYPLRRYNFPIPPCGLHPSALPRAIPIDGLVIPADHRGHHLVRLVCAGTTRSSATTGDVESWRVGERVDVLTALVLNEGYTVNWGFDVDQHWRSP
ncbi:hypothetical protein AWC01_14835 [Mycobacterium doricum]|uniref:Uncharacterized protein n=1 Tax=Mycolicibacterium doricum TaxID=126673 RepID=A0A1X1T116_9MYCO|nr:hypothetical protein AWC01_14835 [Mycolicibacterium doricum]